MTESTDSSYLMDQIIDLTRRSFITTGLATALCLSANPALALPRSMRMKELAFYNLHTDEKLRVTYWKNGEYSRAALDKINHILRDYRTGDVHPVSRNLVDLMHDLQTQLHTDTPIEIISGYRSPKTNALLIKKSDGVARHSYHMQGLATDLRMARVSLRRLRTAALFMRRGGVGFYPKSGFVHVDVGPVRHWG